MSSPEIQENLIYSHLQSFFFTHGYESASPGMEFVRVSETTSKSILFSVGSHGEAQMLEIQLGVEFRTVQSLVSQFLKERQPPAESYTIKATPHLFNRPPLQRFVLTDEASLQLACSRIREFMENKGFRFLNTFARLKRADAVINRKPHLRSSYMPDQVHRCFVGITIARLLQRTDFEELGGIYSNYLNSRKGSEELTESFQKLFNFLKCFSVN